MRHGTPFDITGDDLRATRQDHEAPAASTPPTAVTRTIAMTEADRLPTPLPAIEEPRAQSLGKPDGLYEGEGSSDLVHKIALQLGGAAFRQHLSPEDRTKTCLADVRAFSGINPQDETEALLAAQMVALHENAMECLRRANIPDQPSHARYANLNLAVKLQRAYTLSLEALDRHRGKGRQEIKVSHVHVHEGAQAIVGNVNQREVAGK